MANFKNKGKPGLKGTVQVRMLEARSSGGVLHEKGSEPTIPANLAASWIAKGIAEKIQ